MIIPLDDKYRIRGTVHCWQLETIKIVKGEKQWRAFKYYNSMDSALRDAAQREIRTTPTTTLTEAIAACNRVTQKYAQIFDDVGKRAKGVE